MLKLNLLQGIMGCKVGGEGVGLIPPLTFESYKIGLMNLEWKVREITDLTSPTNKIPITFIYKKKKN